MLFLVNPFITSGQALLAGTGSLQVLGQAALFQSGIQLRGEAGGFAYSGQEAAFTRSLLFSAAAGAIAVDGQIVSLVYGKGLPAAAGGYAVTGNEAGLIRSLLFSAGAGAVTVTGEDAGLLRQLMMAAEAGALALTGQDVSFGTGIRIFAEAGAFALAGQDSALERGAVVQAAAGVYVLSGQGATLRRALRLVAAAGSFAVTGQDAALTYVSQATVSFIGALTSTADQATYTFTDADIGGPGLIVVSAAFDGTATVDLSSVTIGGSAATAVAVNNDQNPRAVGLYQRRIASGTTATIAVNISGSTSRCLVGVWRITGNNSDTPYDTASYATADNSGNNASSTLDGLANGVGIAAHVANNDNRVTWAGMTERYDLGLEGNGGFSGGDTTFSTDETGRTVSVTGVNDFHVLVAASWR